MPSIELAVGVLQVADVEASVRWYTGLFGFEADTFPPAPPFTFAILRRDGAELMLQCAQARAQARPPDREFVWSMYLRLGGTAILDVAADIAKKTALLRGPERMFYGLVEFELCDPDGYRVCVSGEAPPGANVKERRE